MNSISDIGWLDSVETQLLVLLLDDRSTKMTVTTELTLILLYLAKVFGEHFLLILYLA